MAITSVKTGSSFTNLIKYDSFLAGNAAFSPSSYESIATVTVGGGGAASISFTSIPATFQHLQIRALALASSATDYTMRFNGDTGTNYRGHFIYGEGSSVAAGQTFGGATTRMDLLFNNSSTNYGGIVCDILDYKDTNKYKTQRILSGYDANGSGYMWVFSGLWLNTNAVTSISIAPDSGTFSQYSSFALYGIKG